MQLNNIAEAEIAREALRKIVPMFNELLIGQKVTYNRDYKNNLASTILHELAEIRTIVELAKNTVKWEHLQFYADLLDCLIEEGANHNYWCNNYYRAMKEVIPYGCILTRLHKLQKRESTNPATNIEYLHRVLKIAPGNSGLWFLLGINTLRNGDSVLAINCFLRSLEWERIQNIHLQIGVIQYIIKERLNIDIDVSEIAPLAPFIDKY